MRPCRPAHRSVRRKQCATPVQMAARIAPATLSLARRSRTADTGAVARVDRCAVRAAHRCSPAPAGIARRPSVAGTAYLGNAGGRHRDRAASCRARAPALHDRRNLHASPPEPWTSCVRAIEGNDSANSRRARQAFMSGCCASVESADASTRYSRLCPLLLRNTRRLSILTPTANGIATIGPPHPRNTQTRRNARDFPEARPADRPHHRRRDRRPARAGPGRHRPARRRRHRAVHRALPQGSHRRARRHPAAQPRSAPDLPARTRRPPRRGAGQHRRTGQAHATHCAPRSKPPTARRAWKTCTCRTSPSAAPRRRSRARPGLEPLADGLLADPIAGAGGLRRRLRRCRQGRRRRQGRARRRARDPDGALGRGRRAGRRAARLAAAKSA